MNAAFFQSGRDAVPAEHNLLDRGIVCQHSQDGFAAAARFRGRSGDTRALGGQTQGLIASPVIDDHLVSGPEQISRHAGAHFSKSDKPNLHALRVSQARRTFLGCGLYCSRSDTSGSTRTALDAGPAHAQSATAPRIAIVSA